jgi:hypothetical protein
MTTELGGELGVELGVRTTPTSLLSLCTKAFPQIRGRCLRETKESVQK